MGSKRTGMVWTVAVLCALVALPCLAVAGTTGKIAGTVTDPEGGPIVAATLRVEGTSRGAYSGGEGEYTILQVPPGVYEVSCKRLGFEPVLVQQVRVSADETTRLDISMGEATIEMEEVVVTAERPPVDLGLTSSKATVSSEEIDDLPVQNLEEIVNLQAGVVDGHVRGGRQGEVQYQVDGVSVNNAFDNSSTVRIDRSLLQEVQVISGTFDAEYGQAMSGVVNAVLKSGTEDFEWGAEVYTGDQVFPDPHDRLVEDELKLGAIQNFQVNASGPLPIPDTLFLVSGRRYHFDDFLYAERRFATTDNEITSGGTLEATGDGSDSPLGYAREWSGVAKIANTSFENTQLAYQMILNRTEGRRNDWVFRFHPDGRTEQNTLALSHGLDWTQTLSASSYFDFSVRQNYRKYTDWAYEDPFDPRYDAAGTLRVDPDYEFGAFIGGVDFTRYEQVTNSYVFKGSYTNQLDPVHLFKSGVDLELPKVEFGTPGHLVYNQEGGVNTLQRFFDRPPDFPAIDDYHPMIGAIYAQDSMEWPDLTLRAGLRLDYFHSRANLPSDPRNPANAIAGAPSSLPEATSSKLALSPRLGVAYPIEDYASIHFAYGHFRQFPAIGTIFDNSNYEVLANLQASNPYEFGVLGNPDVEPEKTVQYEVGYKQAINQDMGVELTTFYKDIRDLVGVEFITTYTGAQYPRLTNVDFGSVFGFTLALDHRKLGPASLSVDYTWQQALGNTSNPQETANRAEAGEDARPKLIPFNWDQKHTLNATASLGSRQSVLLSGIGRLASGQPYSPIIDRAVDSSFSQNAGRKPLSFLMDLRAEKELPTFGRRVNFFARVFNVFDTRFFNGGVFPTTGSPYYSRTPESDENVLANPTRFYSPRRIEIGIRYGS